MWIQNHGTTSVTENVKLLFLFSLYLQSQSIMWCISWWNQKMIFHPVALAGFQMQTFPVHFWTMLDFFILIIGILLRFLKKTTQTCKQKKKKNFQSLFFLGHSHVITLGLHIRGNSVSILKFSRELKKYILKVFYTNV